MKALTRLTIAASIATVLTTTATTVLADTGGGSTGIATEKSGTVNEQVLFSDVKAGDWFQDSVNWASANKVANGFEDGTFRPNDKVTEGQFLAMLLRSMGDVPDTESKVWYNKYYTFSYKNSYPVTSNPDAPISRKTVAEVISSTQGVSYSGDNAIRYMFGKGLTSGKTSKTIAGYAGDDNLTRAEAVQFIKNALENASSKTPLARPSTASDPNQLTEIPTDVTKPQNNAVQDIARIQVEVGSNYVVKASNVEGVIHLEESSTGNIVANYTDGRIHGGLQMFSIYKTLDSNHQPISNNLEATVKMMQAIGVNVDSQTTDAIKTVLTTSTKKINVQYNGFYILVGLLGGVQVIVHPQ